MRGRAGSPGDSRGEKGGTSRAARRASVGTSWRMGRAAGETGKKGGFIEYNDRRDGASAMCHGQSRWTSFDPSPYRHPTTLFRIHFPLRANHTPRGPASSSSISSSRVSSRPHPGLPHPHQSRPHGHISYHVDLFPLFGNHAPAPCFAPFSLPFSSAEGMLVPSLQSVCDASIGQHACLNATKLCHSHTSLSDVRVPFARQS